MESNKTVTGKVVLTIPVFLFKYVKELEVVTIDGQEVKVLEDSLIVKGALVRGLTDMIREKRVRDYTSRVYGQEKTGESPKSEAPVMEEKEC